MTMVAANPTHSSARGQEEGAELKVVRDGDISVLNESRIALRASRFVRPRLQNRALHRYCVRAYAV